MVSYGIGVLFGILSGMTNFMGQVLQKKAINDTPIKERDEALIKSLAKNPLWITGLVMIFVVSAVFAVLGQAVVGAALIPGLTASGLIVLAIGSVKILKEKLKIFEIIAIIALMIGIFLISLSELSIEGSLDYFDDLGFTIRFFIFSIISLGLWFGLFFGGKTVKNRKSIIIALGVGFPYVLNNLWMQPFIISLGSVGKIDFSIINWIVMVLSIIVIVIGNVLGMGHLQHALNQGNASIVVPVQQLPQQIAPVFIFFWVYNLPTPKSSSSYFLITGILLIIITGFLLAKRQSKLEDITIESQNVD